jgi:ribosomal protein L11 methylase PrmA
LAHRFPPVALVKKDIRYVPSPLGVVKGILDLAGLAPQDYLIDLGSGDGRIPIQAGLRGTRARGIDIDPSLVRRSDYNAIEAGVQSLVDFQIGNFFEADISLATVVTLYLRGVVNRQLKPKLLSELKSGSRIVSHSFEMFDWEPDQEVEVETKNIYLWFVP